MSSPKNTLPGCDTPMNNIISNFDQILEFAADLQVPVNKRRGILREYLQSKFITSLYSQPAAKKMSFVGGTSLRLLRGLPRFSEDLDFDILDLNNDEVKTLIERVVGGFISENIMTETHAKIAEGKTYFEIRFPDILKDLEISTNPREKLMIKVDYSRGWRGQTPETILFSQYGFIGNIVTNTLNQVLTQKLTAYVQRKQTQSRDLYDVVWLYSQGARLDLTFAEKNGLVDLVKKAKNKFDLEGAGHNLEIKLTPFLFNEAECSKIQLFGDVLKKL